MARLPVLAGVVRRGVAGIASRAKGDRVHDPQTERLQETPRQPPITPIEDPMGSPPAPHIDPEPAEPLEAPGQPPDVAPDRAEFD